MSSRAYQKLSGKLPKDDFQSYGYRNARDTEIPQLREHAQNLTEAGRTAHYRQFLNDLNQLMNSIDLWASKDGTQSTLTDSEKARKKENLKRLLCELAKVGQIEMSNRDCANSWFETGLRRGRRRIG